MARKKKEEKVTSVTVDMSDVESGGTVPEGEHLATVIEIEHKISESSGNPYLKWICQTSKGKLFFNTSLQTHALFNLRGLLEAMGEEIPEGPMELDFEELIDNEFVAVVSHEKYDGKMRARVDDYLTTEGWNSDEGDDEVTVSSDDDGDLDKVSEEELGDMDNDDLEEIVEKYGLDVNLKKFKSARKRIGAMVDALEEAGYLDED